MHAIKVGWVGQTFVLAKSNDSGGKKSRIRRSKEDRKALVVSFIKKYQKLNNGSFPSLNLTHKEVGGSFYTVREIVREVIQENKVLGPGMFTLEQQKHDDILEEYPIGSISIEPETELLSTIGSHPVTHVLPHHQDTSEELVPSASVHDLEPEHDSLGDRLYMNGSSKVFQKNEEHERAMCVASEDREVLVLEGTVEDTEASSTKVTCLEADLMVETSPLISGSGLTYGLDDKFGLVNANCGEKEGEGSVVDGMNFLESDSGVWTERDDAIPVEPPLEKSYDLADEKLVGKFEVPMEEDPDNYTAKEDADTLLNHHQDGSVKIVLNANTQDLDPGHQSVDKELQMNGSDKAFEKNEEHERDMYPVSREKEILELDGSVEDLKASEDRVTGIAADVVEAFPLPLASGRTYGLEEEFIDASVPRKNLGEKEENSIVDETNQESPSDLTNARAMANLAGQQLENCCNLVEKPVSKVEVPLEEISEVSMIKEGTVLGTSESIDTEVKDDPVVGIKITDPVKGRDAQGSEDDKIRSSKQTIPKITIATASDPNIQLVDDLKETNAATLDRMNLESWKTLEKSQKPTNPLLAFFKAFVIAFVKFWSE